MATSSKTHRTNSESYDDPKHNYAEYWKGREYEHAAEELAINKLLKGRHFAKAVDVGGGFGRLSKFLTTYADQVVLAEPSQQQLDISKDFLSTSPSVTAIKAQASDLPFEDASVDLVLVVRVLHHLPDPTPEFHEIQRILKPGGTFLLEFANNTHFLNRVRYAAKGKSVPYEPVDIRSPQHQSESEIPFVNHHPKKVLTQLQTAGFDLETVLSGSNLRSATLKKILPKEILIAAEAPMQQLLGNVYFGPSTWMRLVKR